MISFYLRRSRGVRLALSVAAGLLCSMAVSAQDARVWQLNRWDAEPGQRSFRQSPAGVAPATRQWRLCAVYPHLKDGYWLAVNYGMVEEARRLGVGLALTEVGGYHNLREQRERLSAYLAGGRCDAVLVGTVSYDGLTDLLMDRGDATPVFALVNDIDPRGVQGKVGVPWYQLGWEIGRWLAGRHPKGSPEVDIGWFLGPRESGWVPFLDSGFRDAIADSAVRIAVVKWGDTGRSAQRRLVEDALDAMPSLRYLVGTAVMTEVATAELWRRGLQDRVGLVSSYLTPGAYGGLMRGRIQASVTDFPAVQGRLAVQQALAYLEKRETAAFVGPEVSLVERDTVNRYPTEWMLPPADFSPVYELSPDGRLPAAH